MSIDLKKVNFRNLAHFRFKKNDNGYIITNEIGDYLLLDRNNFKRYLEDTLDKKSDVYIELKEKNFLKPHLNTEEFIYRYRQRNNFIWQGPVLHIIVVTLRCNHRCSYCQSSARSLSAKGFDMNKSTARKVVDIIFESPSQGVTIEFQGGEPLVNWDVVKYIVSYARNKAKTTNKSVFINLVTNASLLSENKLKFFQKNSVNPCFSLDGPEYLHDKNRKIIGKGSSYFQTVKWIKKIQKDNRLSLDALATISKYSLKYPRQIIDEYIKWGFTGVHLRYLSNLGFSRKLRDVIGYSYKEFFEFYKEALDYLIELNLKNKTKMFERSAMIFLRKILTDNDPNFLDLRSPCGGGVGQLLYNYDGKVYTCDEARMLEDSPFQIGDAKTDSYKDIISHAGTRTTCLASCLDGLYCDYCAYKPYCGVCPVCSYSENGNIFFKAVHSERCKINKLILDYLFAKLRDERIKQVFMSWIR